MDPETSRREFLQVAAGAGLVLLGAIEPARATPAAMQEAIRKVVGPARVGTGRVKLELPPLSENGNAVPLGVSVESPMTGDDHVRAIAGDLARFLRGVDHVDHLDAGFVGLVGEVGRSTPGEREDRDALGQRHLDGCPVHLADHMVDAEGAVRELPHARDALAELLGIEPQAREDAEASGPRDFGDQLRPGHAAHAGLEDRVLDAEEIAERRSQRVHVHSFVRTRARLHRPEDPSRRGGRPGDRARCTGRGRTGRPTRPPL